MLILSSITKAFGGLQVLHNISLAIPEQRIFGLIGPNGAGKTTLFNIITGLLEPTSGNIEFLGHSLTGLAAHQIARRGIARTFQNIRIFKDMSVIENVMVAMSRQARYSALRVLVPPALLKAQCGERSEARSLLARVALAEKAEILAGSLSYGEQRRLEIARALATRPKFLLLDEPTAGMNGTEKHQLMEDIVKMADGGLSLLIIEHDMRFVMAICQEIAVLNFGQLIAQGTPEQVAQTPGSYTGESLRELL